MAQQKKKTTRKRTTKAATRGKKTNKNKNSSNSDLNVKREITILSVGIFTIFLIAVLYFNIGGVVGVGIRSALFSLFGIGAYLIPPFVIALTIVLVFFERFEDYVNKVLLSFFIIVNLSTMRHVFMIHSAQIHLEITERKAFLPALVTYFKLAMEEKTGGVVGGLIGDAIVILIGPFGARLITVLVLASLIVIIFETSILNIIFKGVKAIVSWVKGASEKSKEQKALLKKRKIEKELKSEPMIFENEAPQVKKKGGLSFLNKSTIVDQEEKNKPIKDNVIPLRKEKEKEEVVRQENAPQEESFQISLFNNKKEKKQRKTQESVKEQNKVEETTFSIEDEIKSSEEQHVQKTMYEFPPFDLLTDVSGTDDFDNTDEINGNARKLQSTLDSFNVGAKVVNVSQGPTVTRYELQPDIGVKVSKFINLTDDIALNLATSGIRIEAPIPGKALIGIEVPNKKVQSVFIKEVLETEEFQKFPSKIAFAVGKDISGETIIADIAKMPHMLISGATGSGKSVCINTLIISILFRAHPDEVKLLMIDPKVVELKVYNGIPHLLIPVVTDAKKAAGALYWAVKEMEERYQLFAAANVRDLSGYNRAVEEKGEGKKLPQIVIIVDELADLMQVAAKDVEDAICRLAQMARAAGIHLILATQRPSVDVITGIIKANIPSRIAFSVSSGIDSRTIIDMNGAEKLVGKGDMLYYPIGMNKPLRVQGAFISDREVENVVNFLMATEKAEYDNTIIEEINKVKDQSVAGIGGEAVEVDAYFEQALELVIDKQKASASMIQRRFKVGYNRAARIVDQLFEAGYVGDEEGSKPRKVLLTQAEYYEMKHGDAGSEAVATEEAIAAIEE